MIQIDSYFFRIVQLAVWNHSARMAEKIGQIKKAMTFWDPIEPLSMMRLGNL